MPGRPSRWPSQIAEATERLRTLDLQKSPGTAEVIDWVEALHLLGVPRLDADAVGRTLGSVVKYREDTETVAAAAVFGGWPVADASGGRPGRRLRGIRPASCVAVGIRVPVGTDLVVGQRDRTDSAGAVRELYWMARVTLLDGPQHVPEFDAVFAWVFRGTVGCR